MAGKYVAKKKRSPLILALAVVLVLALTAGGLFARYRSQRLYETEMIAAGFHISSDYLLEESAVTYTVSDWKNGITIQLYSYEKENTALEAAEPITYKVTVPNDFTLQVKDQTENKEVEGQTVNGEVVYTLAAGKNTHTLTLMPNAEVNAGTVKVTVKTTAPFVKELSAKFALVGEQKPGVDVDRITDNGDYYLVTITTGQYSETVDLSWPADVQPDNTNDVMRTWTGSSGSFDADAFTTYQLIFFNPQGSAYTDTHFPITQTPNQ